MQRITTSKTTTNTMSNTKKQTKSAGKICRHPAPNHRLSGCRLTTDLTLFKRPLNAIMRHRRAAPSQTPTTRPMGGDVQPKTPVLHLSVALHTPQYPIFRPSRAFSFLRPPIYRPTRQESPQTKKATKSSHLATFRRSQFNQIQPHVVQSSPRIKRSTEQN